MVAYWKYIHLYLYLLGPDFDLKLYAIGFGLISSQWWFATDSIMPFVSGLKGSDVVVKYKMCVGSSSLETLVIFSQLNITNVSSNTHQSVSYLIREEKERFEESF